MKNQVRYQIPEQKTRPGKAENLRSRESKNPRSREVGIFDLFLASGLLGFWASRFLLRDRVQHFFIGAVLEFFQTLLLGDLAFSAFQKLYVALRYDIGLAGVDQGA